MAKLYNSACYCTNSRRSANALTDFYNARIKKTGLTVSQYYLLINLSRLGSANVTHWAERVGLDRSTMVRNIKPLIAAKLICPAKGHGKSYALTARGTELLEGAVAAWEAAQREIEAFLGIDDAKTILRITSRLQALPQAPSEAASEAARASLDE